MPDHVRFSLRLLIPCGITAALVYLLLLAGRPISSPRLLATSVLPRQEQPARIANAGLIAEVRDLDFGTVAESMNFPWQLRLTNPTDAEITITEFERPCSCRFNSGEVTIRAGGTMTIPIQFDLTPRMPESASSVRELGWSFIPQIAGHPGRHPGWWIRGISTR